jgi:putative GTP pyrophosphokinase
VRRLKRWQEAGYWKHISSPNVSSYPSPIRTIMTRIKRPERVVDKILRKPAEFPDGLTPTSFLRMHDTIGARILVFFLSQLPQIDREFRHSDIFEISGENPPEAYGSAEMLQRFGLAHIPHRAKESGYSSIHYTVRLKPHILPPEQSPWFEVQVRTLAQEFWSEMEHILAYKSETHANFSARRRLQTLSREISAIDEHFNLLYEELVQNQVEAHYTNSDSLGVENLPAVLRELGVACQQENGMHCAQQDFDKILSMLYSRGIRSVGELRALATPTRLEIIRNTYVSKLGRPPTGLEMMATLASLTGLENSDEEMRRISSHIDYFQSWSTYRDRF